MKSLKNYAKLRDQITDTLLTIDAEFRCYDTDLYIDYDPDAHTGRLVEHPADSFRTAENMAYIGTVNGTDDDATSYIVSVEDAECIWSRIVEWTAKYTGKDDEDVGLNDIRSYVKATDYLYEHVAVLYRQWARDDLKQTFADRTEEMLSNEFEEENNYTVTLPSEWWDFISTALYEVSQNPSSALKDTGWQNQVILGQIAGQLDKQK